MTLSISQIYGLGSVTQHLKKPILIYKNTLVKYAQRLLKPLNIVHKTMLILNFLPLVVFYLIDIKAIKELVVFGFFYMTIWALIPCLLLSITLYFIIDIT